MQTCQTLCRGGGFMLGVTQGQAEHQQGEHRSRIILQDCIWGSPGPTTSVHKQQGRFLFSREWDQFLPEICQEAFPHKYTRNVNRQYSFPHSPVDKFVKQFQATPTPNNSLVTHQLPFTCRVLSRSPSAFSWDSPGHARGALHAVHNP